MSILTKVFVVLVTFLSVLLVALVVPFVARTEDFKTKLQAEQDLKLRAQAAARARESEITELASREGERFTALMAEKRNLTSTITQLSESLASANSGVQQLQADKAKQEANLNRLTAAADQYGQITKSLQEELNLRRDQLVDLQTRSIELADRNDDLATQLEAANRQVRRSREQTVELQQQITRLEGFVAKLDPAIRQQITAADQTVGDTEFVPATTIRGHITRVEQAGGETFVQMDIGGNDGVEVNMKFWVHRGGQFLGTAVVVKVDTNASAARMRIVEGAVAAGDTVLTGGMGL